MKKNEQNKNSKQRTADLKKATIMVGATGVMALACNDQCPQQPEKIVPQDNKKELSEYDLEQLYKTKMR